MLSIEHRWQLCGALHSAVAGFMPWWRSVRAGYSGSECPFGLAEQAILARSMALPIPDHPAKTSCEAHVSCYRLEYSGVCAVTWVCTRHVTELVGY